MKLIISSVILVIFIMGIQDVQSQVRMEPQQCPKVIQNCMSKDYAEVVQADKECNDCCRRAGCSRGDCSGKKCACKRC